MCVDNDARFVPYAQLGWVLRVFNPLKLVKNCHKWLTYALSRVELSVR